jgi:putative tricarboxylic transport membrane protein
MKRVILTSLLILAAATLVFAGGQTEAEDGAWAPKGSIQWYCTSSPGGGSSIFTQSIIEIIKEEGLVDGDIMINYKTDGGGAVGRREVSRKEGGTTLLTFNNGDLQPLVQIEGGDLDGFTPLAVMATDGQVLLVRNDSRFKKAEDFLNAVKAGERVIIGGSKGDDVNLFNKIKEEVGGDLEYLMNDSTGDALTQILGGSIEIVIAKPAASYELVTSGELRPLMVATRDRLNEPFAAPTLKELGYNIELTVYRGIVGPANMPAEAVAFWSDVFTKVAATPQWKENYLNKFLLNGNHLPADKALDYMQAFEDIYTSAK